MKKITPVISLLMFVSVACTPDSQAPSERVQSPPEQATPTPRAPITPVSEPPEPAPHVKMEPVDFRALPKTTARPSRFEDFVGAKTCAGCHRENAAKWKKSTHGLAGGKPSKSTIVAPFDGRPLKFSDGTITPRVRQGRYEFHLEQSGRPPETYSVDGVIGRGHLYGGGAQTFLSERPNGLVVPLPLEYNVTKSRWYCQLLGATKWTPINGSFTIETCGWPPGRSMGFAPGAACGNCHGSQIDLRFDEKRGQFSTRYTDLHINCESCHGAGKRHVTLMKAGGDGATDIGLASLDLLDKQASMRVCLGCHVTKVNISGGYLAAGPYDEHASTLALWDPRERKDHFDGRLVKFGYQQGHLYSPCFTDGSMTCVDCHDPHTLAYRDPFGEPLKGRFSDGQCVGCHPSKIGTDHSRHAAGSEASRCTTCHMPYHQLSTVGDALPHARSDHAIPIPRPQHDAQLGVDGACNRCHGDKGIAWQERAMETLYGAIKPQSELAAELFKHFGDWSGPEGTAEGSDRAEALVADHTRPEAIASIYALSFLFAEKLAVHGGDLKAATQEKLWRLNESDDLDVRAAALTTLLFFAENPSATMKRIYDTLATSGDQQIALRRKIVYGLIGVDHAFSRLSPKIRQRIRARLEREGLELADGTLGLRPAIGASYMAEKRYSEAAKVFEEAVDSPAFAHSPYAMNIVGPRPAIMELLADAYGASGDVKRAEEMLERVMKLSPKDVRVRHRVCRQLSMAGRFRDAERCVKALLRLQPGFVEGYFVRAQLLEKLGRLQEAIGSLETGLKYAPNHGGGQDYLKKLQQRAAR